MPVRSSATTTTASPDAPYRTWAAAMLAITVVLGAWMRAMTVWPAAAPRALPFPHLVHAHSHVAFFGWLVLALGATFVRGPAAEARRGAHRAVAHAIGVLSLLALAAFAWEGYSARSIVISALHVALWVVFVRLAWPLEGASAAARPWLRGALVGLVAAGSATLLPGILTARGVESGWLRDTGIEAFLNLFIFGWVVLGCVGRMYERTAGARWSRPALALVAAGLLPSTFLYVATPAPAAWPLVAGRVGALLVGAGLLLAAVDLRRAWPLPGLPALPLALVGALEMVAASGVGAALLHSRPIVLAFVHLVLLGVATPVLLAERGTAPRRVPVAALYGGLAAMLAALVVMGWPTLLTRAATLHVGYAALLAAAFWGGALAAAACLALLVRHRRRAPALGARPHTTILESTAP